MLGLGFGVLGLEARVWDSELWLEGFGVNAWNLSGALGTSITFDATSSPVAVQVSTDYVTARRLLQLPSLLQLPLLFWL